MAPVAETANWGDDDPSICFVTTDFVSVIRNGGIGTHFWLMSRLLAQRGWDVHVVFCGDVDDVEAMEAMPARMAVEGVNFHWLEKLWTPVWKRIPTYVDAMHNLFLSQWALEALEQLHAEHSFDIIEFQDWRALGFRPAQAKRSGLAFADVALAVKLHSTTAWQRRGNLAHRDSVWDLKVEWCERYAFERADIQLSPSRYMAEDTRTGGWEVRDDILVAYPFPGPEAKPTAQDKGLRRLAFFGRLERRKGLDIFLDAVEELPPELPVVFLGRDTKMDGRSAKEIIQERLGDRPYEIMGELDREAALAELSDGETLAVIASQTETFGFTVAECVTNRIPFIAARAGGIPEVVRHPEAREHWLFEPTAANLAAAIKRRFAADPRAERELRHETAKACDFERWNDEVEKTYRDAVARFRRHRTETPGESLGDVSVAVAVAYHNHGEFLPAALESIARQTRQPDEVFVIDDGSTDPRAVEAFDEMERSYPNWSFIRQENQGPGAARNRCLDISESAYFLPFDSDNVARPELIATLCEAVSADPSRDVLTCHTLGFGEEADIDAEEYAFRFAPTGGPRILAPVENVFGDTCALFRSDALRDVGGFETDRRSHEDWETMAKLAFAGYDLDVVPRALLWYRTDVGGRRETLTEDPANEFRLHRRMVQHILGDVDLSQDEREALWECLTAFTAPNNELAFLQQAHDEAAEWAVGLAESNAEYEQRLRDMVSGHQQALINGDPAALAWVPLRRLWSVTVRRTVRGVFRRIKARAKWIMPTRQQDMAPGEDNG